MTRGERTPTGVHEGRVGEAIAYAIEAHDRQRRKGTATPYASHLLAVTALVLEHGGTPAQACAAVLHDVVEDCGGLDRLADVRATFGDEIGDMVEELSDSTAEDAETKPPWRDRKVAYLARLLEHADSPATLVSLADKTHNAEAIVADLADPLGDPGLGVFGRFRASAMEVAWFYLELAAAFRAVPGIPRRLTDRLRAAALAVHDHAMLVDVVPGGRKQMAVGHAVWAGTWGVLPVETLEAWEAAVARFQNCRTVGDVRAHPSLPHDRFTDRLTWLGLVETYEDVDGDDPQSDAEALQVTPGEWLPDDLPLWSGWDLPIADEVEFPVLPDVPWEDGWVAQYESWAPDEVRVLIEDGDDLDSPMQEVTRATLAIESIEELRSAAEAAGWEVVDGGGRYAAVAFGIERPYAGGWAPSLDQPPMPDPLTVPLPAKRRRRS